MERLEGVRRFTLAALKTSGAVGAEALQDFLALGHTSRNALEVVPGIGTYTISTPANRMTGAPVGTVAVQSAREDALPRLTRQKRATRSGARTPE